MPDPTPPDPIDDLVKDERYHWLIQRVRHFMRDYEELNRIIAGQESSDRDIAMSIMFTVDDLNMTPPPLNKTLDQMIQAKWTGLIVYGAVIRLLESLILHYDRNFLPFNDGGLMTSGLSDKSARLQAWVNQQKAWYENYKTRVKVSANINEMMGISPSGVPSEFSLVHGYRSFYP